MSLEQLYIDYNIPIAGQDDRHYREGWVNTVCPFCTGNPGFHLGWNIKEQYYHCHRCGGHSTRYTLITLLDITYKELKKIELKYDLKDSVSFTPDYKKSNQKINIHPFKYPTDTNKLKTQHKKYLIKRKFDPKFLIKEFNLLGTGPISMLDKKNYCFRIIAPIFWNNKIVSFQGRDITNKQKPKYKACPKEREILHHQNIVYCNPKDNLRSIKRGIIVEGIADVWRFRRNTCCTFGTSFTPAQIRCISKLYDEIFTIYDPEIEAQKQALKLKSELQFRGLKVENILLKTDPGEMDQDEAFYLLKQLKL